jgi:hypothetical protein
MVRSFKIVKRGTVARLISSEFRLQAGETPLIRIKAKKNSTRVNAVLRT